jgi:rRNA-processing protein FCF1
MITREQVKAIANTIFIFDTNNLLHYTCLLEDLTFVGRQESPQRYLVVIPRVVLREIDGLKRSEGAWGFQAREFSRQLERFIQSHPRNALGANTGACTVYIDQETELMLGIPLRQLDPDEILLQVARHYQQTFGDIAKVDLCTADRNLAILARQAGIAVVDFLDWIATSSHSLLHSNLPRTMPFRLHNQANRAFQMPGVLGRAERGVLCIWPGRGYQSGEVCEYHLAYWEGDYRSPTLVLAAGPVLVRPMQEGAFTMADFRFADRDHLCVGVLALPNRQMVRVASDRCTTLSIPHGVSAREQPFFTELRLNIEVAAVPGHLSLTLEDPAAGITCGPRGAPADAPASLRQAAP